VNALRARAQARRFASLLDADDFDGARALISAGCVYDSGRGVHNGPEAIVHSYRAASRLARSRFDDVCYESETVDADDGSAIIEFRDVLSVGDQRHVYSCRQRLSFGSDERITRIEQVDLPGERRRVEAFCARVGVKLDR